MCAMSVGSPTPRKTKPRPISSPTSTAGSPTSPSPSTKPSAGCSRNTASRFLPPNSAPPSPLASNVSKRSWLPRDPPAYSGQQALHDISMNVGETVVAALKFERQPGVINAEAVQQRGVQVVNVHRVAHNVVA